MPNQTVMTYKCKVCKKEVQLVYLPWMEGITFDIFCKMTKERKCKDCYCESGIIKTAEKIMEGLCLH